MLWKVIAKMYVISLISKHIIKQARFVDAIVRVSTMFR